MTVAARTNVTEAELFESLAGQELTEHALMERIALSVSVQLDRLPRLFSPRDAFVLGRRSGWIATGETPGSYRIRIPE